MSADGQATIAVPAVGTYRIDAEESAVAYTGKHLFGLGTVHATFRVRHGELQVANPLSGSTVSVTVDAGSFTSDRARRDEDVRGAKLLDVATYPDITFRADHLSAGPDHWTVPGIANARGQDVPVTVMVDRVAPEGDGVRIHGIAEHLDRHAFGVTGSKGMVGRWVDLELDVLAVPV